MKTAVRVAAAAALLTGGCLVTAMDFNRLFDARRDCAELFTVRVSGNLYNRTVLAPGPVRDGDAYYECAVADNSASDHLVRLPAPGSRFRLTLAVNRAYSRPGDQLDFSVEADGRVLAAERIAYDDPARPLAIDLGGVREFTVKSRRAAGGAQVASLWIDPAVELEDGTALPVGEAEAAPGAVRSLLPAFSYGGAPFHSILWRENTEELSSEDPTVRRFRKLYTAPDGLLRLSLSVKVYRDFPAVEWLPELTNLGATDTAMVEDFRSLKLVFNTELREHTGPVSQRREVTVRRQLGSKCMDSDFVARPFAMSERFGCDRMTMTTDEGRSSAAWLPFFGIDLDEDHGFDIGIGWTGAWDARFNYAGGRFSADAGMLRTHFRLHPGESVRLPGVLLVERAGRCLEEGRNTFRQLMLAHYAPRDAAGRLIDAPIADNVWGGLNTAGMLAELDKVERYGLGYDALWADAGWYGPDGEDDPDLGNGSWQHNVGNWRINRALHPDGLAPVAAQAHRLGMKMLLWFEIERASRGTPVTLEHPEWFVSERDDSDNLMLDLDNPDARRWALATVAEVLETNAIDIYRQDFNFNALPYWAKTDAPDRVGISEMRYIAGLYAYLDALRRRFPDLLIDNCASGGRRLDYEMASRSIPLWRSDVQCFEGFDDIQNQIQLFYLSNWLPRHTGGVAMPPEDDYRFFSGVSAGGTFPGYSFVDVSAAPEWYRNRLEHARRMRPFFDGDFHPLTEKPELRSNWCAYQLAAGGDGLVMIFRRPEAPDETQTLRLRAIDPDASYELEDQDGVLRAVSGAELAQLEVTLPPRGCRLYYYRLQ